MGKIVHFFLSDVVKLKALKSFTDEQLERYGRIIGSSLDFTEYKIKSSLLVQFLDVGHHVIDVTTSNILSSDTTMISLFVQAAADGLVFDLSSPPVVNKTSNVSFIVDQVSFVTYIV